MTHTIARLADGKTICPGQTFVARSTYSRRAKSYTFRGSVGSNADGTRWWLNAIDRRGNCRSVAYEHVIAVRRYRPDTHLERGTP